MYLRIVLSLIMRGYTPHLLKRFNGVVNILLFFIYGKKKCIPNSQISSSLYQKLLLSINKDPIRHKKEDIQVVFFLAVTPYSYVDVYQLRRESSYLHVHNRQDYLI